jgi:hypothetical protein
MGVQMASAGQQWENMDKVKKWCEKHKERIIKVDVISRWGDREQIVNRANGQIMTIEEHPSKKGVFRIDFNSHIWENPAFDYIMLGYEVIGVQDEGETLTIQKHNQRIVLEAQ